MRFISSRVENLIRNMAKMQEEYTVHTIERALEARARSRARNKFAFRRPTHREVEQIIARAEWSVCIFEGDGNHVKIYKFKVVENGETRAKE